MNTEKLIETLKKAEGFKAEPYPDGGGWSIGYGEWTAIKPKGPITQQEAEARLRKTIEWRQPGNVGNPFPILDVKPETLNDVRQRVIMEMVYNLGLHGLTKFVKLIYALRNQDWHTAAIEILDSKAARQNPQRYSRMATMMRTGEDEA